MVRIVLFNKTLQLHQLLSEINSMGIKTTHIARSGLLPYFLLLISYWGFFCTINAQTKTFQKKAKIGDLWRVLAVNSPSDLYVIYEIPGKVDVEPYWQEDNNRHISLTKTPLEIGIRKVGGTLNRKYYLVDLYTAHRFDPEDKMIVGSGWIPAWFVTRAERIVDETRSKVLKGIRFATGSHEITRFATSILANIRKEYRRNKFIRIIIEGHTDNIGSDTDNLYLSIRRAKSVRDYIVKKLRIPAKQVSYIGFGETRPKMDNTTENGRSINRRIEMKMFR